LKMANNRWFDYDSALVRGLAFSFEHALMKHPQPISIETALEQHATYTALLTSLLGHDGSVMEVDKDEDCPDCVFIEDAVLAIPSFADKGSLFITTRPGAEERRDEVGPVKAAMVKAQWTVAELPASHEGEPCFLDGGDVLFDGKCLWVGLTLRTNMAAARALGQMLPWMSVVAVCVEDPSGSTLHLKSLASAIDTSHLLMADNEAGRMLYEAMKGTKEGLDFKVTWVPDQLCANILRIRDHVVMQAPSAAPLSQPIIEQLCKDLGLKLHILNMGELAKADGALTCCSILFKRGQAVVGVE
jgi:dimethylargininase